MLFKKEHILPMLLGRKVTTRRKIKKKKNQAKPTPTVKVGNQYKAQLKMFTKAYFCKFEATNLQRGILGDMTEDDAIREGYPNLVAFREAWAAIHEEPYNATQKVWVIDFKVTETPAPYLRVLEIVPKGTEENVADLDYMLDKYPELEMIFNPPKKEHTRSEAYDVLFEPPKEEVGADEMELQREIEQDAAAREEASWKLDDVVNGEATLGAVVDYKKSDPEDPKVTAEDLAKVGSMTLEEARQGVEQCYARIRDLQTIQSDAETQLLKAQKDLGEYQYYLKRENIRKRQQIKRSYVDAQT